MRKFLSLELWLIALFAILPLLALPIFYDHYALVKAEFVYIIAPVSLAIALLFFSTRRACIPFPKISNFMKGALYIILVLFISNLLNSKTKIWDTPLIIRGAFLCLVGLFYLGFIQEKIQLLIVAKFTLVSAIGVSFIGLSQVFGFFPLRMLNPGAGGPHATFGNVNMTAEFMALAMFMHWYILLKEQPRKIVTQLTFAAAGTLFSTYLFLLASRSAWLVVVLVMFFLIVRSRTHALRQIIPPLILGIGLGFVVKNLQRTLKVPSDYPNVSVIAAVEKKPYRDNPRYEVWRDGLTMIKEHPWLGVGPENYEFSAIPYRSGKRARIEEDSIYSHPHNEWLKFAIEDGLPFSLLLGTLVFFMAWHRLVLDLKSHKEEEIIITIAFLVFYLIQGTFQFPFSNAVPFTYFALFLARCLRSYQVGYQYLAKSSFFPGIRVAVICLCLCAIVLQMRFLKSQYLMVRHSEDPKEMKLACDITPGNWRACMGYAHLALLKGDFTSSFATLEQMLKKQPNNFLALKLYGLGKIAQGDQLNGCLSLRIFDFLLKGRHSQKDVLTGLCHRMPPLILGGDRNILSQYKDLGLAMTSSRSF